MKNYIGISRDHSGSMSTITNAAMKDYNTTVESIRNAAKENNIETFLSVVQCGVGRSAKVVTEMTNVNINNVGPIYRYEATGAATPLFDSVWQLIQALESAPDANDPETAFVVMVITDGQENSSFVKGYQIAAKIAELSQTDKWTFVFRVPRGATRQITQYGIPAGNVLEWDQTQKGVEESTRATNEAFTQFYAARSMGTIRSTSTFYTNLNNVTKADISAMSPITHEVKIVAQNQPGKVRIDEFCEKEFGTYLKGAGFYQLVKREKEVQDYKKIVLRDLATGYIYGGGDVARRLLGLPSNGTVAVAPGDHKNYEIYIQSTSLNRLIPQYTKVLYWKDVR